MKFKSFYTNITIKQANILTLLVVFVFSLFFVALLVEEMYKDYESSFEHSVLVNQGAYTNDELLVKKRQTLKAFFIKIVLVIVTLSFILFGIFLGINNIFNRFLQRDTQTFLDFFEEAVNENKMMDEDKIFFKDFKVMLGYANEMVSEINKQKKSLIEMNTTLEDRVKSKTAKLEAEKAFSHDLLNAQKEFLRYTVHETNTPLSVILTSIELYTMKHPKDRQLSKIEAAVKNIFSIYDDLSYLVKKDQVEYPKIMIDIEKYLKSRLDFFTEVAELSRIKFEYKSENISLHVYFNETKLQRIVDNTITNAIKYTLPDEVVYVKLLQIGAMIEFSMSSKSKIIKDTDKVFETFYREENTKDGFGLGLGLVRSICKEENVALHVDSDNQSTSFTYRFKMMGE